MQAEEIKLFNDTIQDTRHDATIKSKYETLIDFILNSAEIKWDQKGLTLKSEDALYTLVKTLDPEKYYSRFRVLKDIKEDEKEE